MRQPPIIDPHNQPETNAERRLGVVPQREANRTVDRLGRYQERGGVIIVDRNGRVVGDGIRRLIIPGDLTVLGDAATFGAIGTPSYTLQAAAGATATASIAGDDTSGVITLTPGGAGLALGSQIQLDFAVNRGSTSYSVHLQRSDTVAGDLDLRVVGKTSARFRVYAMIAPTGGSVYSIGYSIRKYD